MRQMVSSSVVGGAVMLRSEVDAAKAARFFEWETRWRGRGGTLFGECPPLCRLTGRSSLISPNRVPPRPQASVRHRRRAMCPVVIPYVKSRPSVTPFEAALALDRVLGR